MSWSIQQGDCLEVLTTLEEGSIDSVVVDPPYGIGFMGHEWDQPGEAGRKAGKITEFGRGQRKKPAKATASMVAGEYDLSTTANRRFQAWCEVWATELYRVLKPGGYLLAFGGTRTYHRLAAGIEDAGFEIRDCLAWIFGSGFPKSHNLDGDREGWGTALKPGHEPIVMARRPLIGTVAANVAAHGTGALNIDGCRIEASDKASFPVGDYGERGLYGADGERTADPNPGGRWPANVLLDPEAGATLDAQTGELISGPESDRGHRRNADREAQRNTYGGFQGQAVTGLLYGDRGGASRFFYCAKSSRAERNAGLTNIPERTVSSGMGAPMPTDDLGRDRDRFQTTQSNIHPTVKPIDLMRWCVRLVTPPGGTVLDSFTGSGTTGIAAVLEGFDFLGIERESEYIEIANARLAWWAANGPGDTADVLVRAGLAEKAQADHREAGQMTMEIG